MSILSWSRASDVNLNGYLRGLFTPAVNNVVDGHKRVLINHFRAGIPHNTFNRLALFRFVAMDPAITTGRLALLERALAEAQQRVFLKLSAIPAQLTLAGSVLVGAIDIDHYANRLGLAPHSLIATQA